MKPNRNRLGIVAVLFTALLLAACGDNTATTSPATSATASTTGAATTAGATTTSAATSTTAATTTTSAAGTSTTSAANTIAATSTTSAVNTTTAAGSTTSATGATTSAASTTTSAAGSATTPATGSATTAASTNGATTPGATPVVTSASSAFTYPNAKQVVEVKPDLEAQFKQTFASNISNASLLTFTTADDPAKVADFFNQKLTGLGYTAAQSSDNPLQTAGLKGQVLNFNCAATANGAASATPSNAILPTGCKAPAAGSIGTASTVRVVAVGPLDTTLITSLTTLAPALAPALKSGDSIVMVFAGSAKPTA